VPNACAASIFIAVSPPGGGDDGGEPFQRFRDPVDLWVDSFDCKIDLAAERLARQPGERLEVRLSVTGCLEYPFAGRFVLMRRGGEGEIVARAHGIDESIGLRLGQRRRNLRERHGGVRRRVRRLWR
jgi:hypothetical protein